MIEPLGGSTKLSLESRKSEGVKLNIRILDDVQVLD